MRDLPKVPGRQKQAPDAHSLGSSHHTEGFTCRAAPSPRASSVCSKITWALEQRDRPSSSRKTANESADFSNPRVKGVLSGAWAGLNLPTSSGGAKNEIIPLITPGVVHFNSMNGVTLANDPDRLKPSLALKFVPSIRKDAFLKILILTWSGEGQKAPGI